MLEEITLVSVFLSSSGFMSINAWCFVSLSFLLYFCINLQLSVFLWIMYAIICTLFTLVIWSGYFVICVAPVFLYFL